MEFISLEQIKESILAVRSHRVLLDSDLAKIYGGSTKQLNQQVKRNLDRFPSDFMFQVTENEEEYLRSQIVTSNEKRGGRRHKGEEKLGKSHVLLKRNLSDCLFLQPQKAFKRIL